MLIGNCRSFWKILTEKLLTFVTVKKFNPYFLPSIAGVCSLYATHREVEKVHALFYQYRVLPSKANELHGKISGAMATVLVFADTDDIGRARCGRFIARHHWEIEKFLRVMFMGPQQIENLNAELVGVYKQAEKFGIAACFDSWSTHHFR